MVKNYYQFQNGNSRDIITWVFCEECHTHDDAKREIPNYMTEEVDIIKVSNDFSGPKLNLIARDVKTQSVLGKTKSLA